MGVGVPVVETPTDPEADQLPLKVTEPDSFVPLVPVVVLRLVPVLVPVLPLVAELVSVCLVTLAADLMPSPWGAGANPAPSTGPPSSPLPDAPLPDPLPDPDPTPWPLAHHDPDIDPNADPDADALDHDEPDVLPLAEPPVGVHAEPVEDNCSVTVTAYESDPHPLCDADPGMEKLLLPEALPPNEALPLAA
jgi:hypothetical protein